MLRASWKRTGTRLLVFVLAGFLALVGVALGGDLRDARKETEQSYREWRESERELERLLEENQRLDAETLPQVQMPNRDGFVLDDRPDVGPTTVHPVVAPPVSPPRNEQ